VGGQTVVVPVKVSGQKEKFEVSFVRDVMPVISKIGCNAGTCHGAAKGKNGFKLSLRGYDPLADHQALTDDIEGRRFNRAAPEQSLMLLKPSGGVPHQGGVVTQVGDPHYRILHDWIADGVRLDLNDPRVTSIDINPKSPIMALPGVEQQMAVMAHFSDGSERDVSAEAFIETSNREVASVDKNGLVTAVRRGEATMLARYEGNYTATTLIVMGDRSGFQWQETPEYNYIDQLVDEKLKQMRILPSGLCTDTEFIRRVYLDLTGLPPSPEEVRSFLADPKPSRAKREALIDRLVGGRDYIEYWTNKWADLLQVNRKFLGEKGALALRNWIRQAVASNLPYEQFVYTILTASGSTLENPPAAYYKVLRDADGAWRTPRSSSWPCVSTATSATTTRSSAGRRTSITRWRPSSPRSAARKTRISRGKRWVVRTWNRHRPWSRSSSIRRPARSSTSAPAPSPRPCSLTGSRTRSPHRPAGASNWPAGSPRGRTPTSPKVTSTGSGATC